MSANRLKNIFIVGAKRTPFGTFGGKLKDHTSTDLAVVAAKSALETAKVQPEWINTVAVGNVIQSSKDAAYVARHTALRCGIPVPVPAVTVNRLCGSGFESIVYGAREIQNGESEIALCGGTENMSQAPFALRNSRFGMKLGEEQKLEDTLWSGLTDQYINTPMGVTAENLAEQYNISRDDVDKFALQSQTRWKNAQAAGVFKEEMAPIVIKTKKGEETIDKDEHPRETSPESLKKLPPVFKKNGTVTAGNASGICDGAGAVIIASEEAVNSKVLKPLVRIVGWHVIGCEPRIMGIGPAHAIRALCEKTGISLSKIDLFEVNEAFGSQFLAVQKEACLPDEKTNVNGGAIALGHPLGASGSRIMAHLTHELRRRKGKYAIGSACIGGGQGIAIMIENVGC
ncbi:3-ketoacyl-CoA thiolase, mitochondrial-like [Paramacrobiotus metropolitanus]|uniref:3-ketoacyl-CoA thiolase, mitochondrial-like n=1 Tax=Paramacrobiotus metropolitanus TaxID=2943436 RepID=UPI002445DDEC|nr:3-ketoacyl-CoA thiolase, mitochondrial-like [Paramacrobiotus metropolitanus]